MNRKKLLFCRSFGIGNALMSVPAIKHYARNGFDVYVIVGSTPDDEGAYDILTQVRWPSLDGENAGGVYVHKDPPPGHQLEGGGELVMRWNRSLQKYWDVGVFSIPYDGRWKWLEQFCHEVVDGRPRPDPSTFGFSSWLKHETEYQVEVAEQVTGVKRPRFFDRPFDNRLGECAWSPSKGARGVYLGVGRKRDAAGFWEKKHWGDENYAELVEKILDRTDFDVVSTGNRADMVTTIAHIRKKVGNTDRFGFAETPIHRAVNIMTRCHSFIGNDTGTMHLAAAIDLPIVAVFNLEGTLRKNHPLSDPLSWRVLEGHQTPVTVDQVYEAWARLDGV